MRRLCSPLQATKEEIISLYLVAVPNAYNEKSILAAKPHKTHSPPSPAIKSVIWLQGFTLWMESQTTDFESQYLILQAGESWILHRGSEQRGCKSRSLICSQVSHGRDAAMPGCVHTVAWMWHAEGREIVMDTGCQWGKGDRPTNHWLGQQAERMRT